MMSWNLDPCFGLQTNTMITGGFVPFLFPTTPDEVFENGCVFVFSASCDLSLEVLVGDGSLAVESRGALPSVVSCSESLSETLSRGDASVEARTCSGAVTLAVCDDQEGLEE